MSLTARQDHFRIHLEAFEGPLDLLLFLIRRAEVDIADIQITRITDEYLAILSEAAQVDVEAAGEFLVMAATLVELKSRTLIPVEVREALREEAVDRDPRQALIQQLLDYQRIRLAAEGLVETRDAANARIAVRIRTLDVEREEALVELDLEDVHAMDLADAYERIASVINFDRLGDHVVSIDDTPIVLHQADLLDRLQRRDGTAMDLLEIFAGCSAPQRVGLFLATLELVRQGHVHVDQEGDGPILLQLLECNQAPDGVNPSDAPLDEDDEALPGPNLATAPDEAP